MRVVPDTNVWISALMSHGFCRALFTKIEENHDILISTAILDELIRVVERKIPNQPDLVDSLRKHLLSRLGEEDMDMQPQSFSIKDPDDIPILNSAIRLQADVFITGDHELLAIPPDTVPIRIVSPRQFWIDYLN